MRVSLTKKVDLGFGLALVILVLIGLMSYRSLDHLVETTGRVEHTHEVLSGLAALLEDVTETESQQRGYVITGDPEYQESVDLAVTAVRERLAALEEETSDNELQQERLGRLGRLVEDKLAFGRRTLELRQGPGFAAARDLIRNKEGLALMGQIRAAVAELEAEERRLLGLRRASAVASARLTRFVIVLGSLLAFGFVGVSSWFIYRDVRRRVRAEAALQETTALQRAVLDSANYSVISVGPEGLIRTFNRAAERWLGYTAGEMVGRQTPVIIHDPREVAERARALARELGRPVEPGLEVFVAPVREAGTPDEREWTYVRKDGSRFPVRLSVTAVRDEGGAVLGYMGIASDITEQRRAQERQATLYAVAQDLSEADTVADAARRVLRQVCERHGWDLGAVWLVDGDSQTLQCLESWHADGAAFPAFAAAMRDAAFAAGTGLPGRVWLAGRPAWVVDVQLDANFPRAAAAERDGLRGAFALPVAHGGQVLGVIEFFSRAARTPAHDLLQAFAAVGQQFGQFLRRKQTEAELHRNEAQTRLLLNSAAEGIYGIDRAGRCTFCNAACVRLLGYRAAAELIGQEMHTLIHHTRPDGTLYPVQDCPIYRAFREGRGSHVADEVFWRGDGSSFPAEYWSFPLVQDGESVGCVVSFLDITERRRAEGEVRRARDAAEAASRAKSEFLANMSHELRTPLNSVIGFTNILLKNKAGNLRAQDLNYLGRIAENGKHLLGLINSILDLSKIEAGRMQPELSPVSLDGLIHDTLAQLEGRTLGGAVKLFVSVPPDLAPLHTDAGMLKQVLINLVGNALKFTEAGSVTVRVTAGADHRPERLDVIDTGVGIPADKLQTVFEAFQQADTSTARKYGGTGLGLTISRALCQVLGYRITVASEVGRGTTFSVLLAPDAAAGTAAPSLTAAGTAAPPDDASHPLTREFRLDAAPAPAAEAAPVPGRPLVLVIDDEPDARLLLTQYLEDSGCRVVAAGSAEQGLRLARECRPALITLDLMMPRMNGWEALKALKGDEQTRDVPVVIVSIVAGESRGLNFGVVDYLDKPVTREGLLAVLRRYLAPERGRVLVVEDAEQPRGLVRHTLDASRVEHRTAAGPRDAFARLAEQPTDLIVLDLRRPETDGLSFLEELRADARYLHLPVVVATDGELTPEQLERLGGQLGVVLRHGRDLEQNLRTLLQSVLLRGRGKPPAGV